MNPRSITTKQSLKINLSRESHSEEVSCKRAKVINIEENGGEACRRVSCSAYSDLRARLLLIYLPACLKKQVCKHNHKNGKNIREMPSYAEEIFNIDIRHRIFYEALEFCEISITPVQYLSANVLKEVVEIMLNVNTDTFMSDETAPEIIDKCQQVLAQIFSTHPPCIQRLRTCYLSFLTSPMNPKENTFTNRKQYGYRSGIVKYCMNRLENEISSNSEEGPIINKSEYTPEEMRTSVEGLHWQKEKFEIFEVLNRPDRIERLMAVLESIVELLQFELAIWQSRHINNFTSRIKKSHKPLMALLLWSDSALCMGEVTDFCRQIMRLFVRLIHLQYPESIIQIITTWLNMMIQTFYIFEQNSNSNYPNTSENCIKFANVFYKIMSEMPHESISRILYRIEPAFMRHLIGMIHIQKITKTNNECIISIIINFFKESQWRLYSPDDTEIVIPKKLFPNKPKKTENIMNCVINVLNKCGSESEEKYSKFNKNDIVISRVHHCSLYHLVHTLYTTLEAFLNAYDVQSVEETWNKLNQQISDDSQIISENGSYYVTEDFIKKYKDLMKKARVLQAEFHNIKSSGEMPDMLEIFTNMNFFISANCRPLLNVSLPQKE